MGRYCGQRPCGKAAGKCLGLTSSHCAAHVRPCADEGCNCSIAGFVRGRTDPLTQGHVASVVPAKQRAYHEDSMSAKNARTPRNLPRPKATSSGNASNEVVRAKIPAYEPAKSARNSPVARVDGAPPQPLCAAIEDQCVCLLDVLGAIHCMSIGFVTQTENPAPEFSAAFDLLEREIHRVIRGLKEISLRERDNTENPSLAAPAQYGTTVCWSAPLLE
jgi:hypothetical protein